MQWNIKDGIQNRSQQGEINNNLNNKNKQMNDKHNQNIKLKINTINENKLQYIGLLLMLLQIIISVIVIVLFFTLNYIEFGKVSDSKVDKIIYDSNNCDNKYLQSIGKYITIKIKTAFIFSLVQLILAFGIIVFWFIWTIKTIKSNNNRMNKQKRLNIEIINKQQNSKYKPSKIILIILNILVPTCITLVLLQFGTYLSFAVLGNKTINNQSCRLIIVNRQIIAIVVLLGIKLVFYLLIQFILLYNTCLFNHNTFDYKRQNNLDKLKFPQFNELSSVQNKNNNNKYNIHKPVNYKQNQNIIISRVIPNNYNQNFNSLRTQQFLIQPSNHPNNQQLNKNINKKINTIQHYHNLQDVNKNQQLRPLQQETTNRRLIYQPLQHQIVVSDRNIQRQTNKYDNKKQQINFKSLQEEFMVNNSILISSRQQNKQGNNQIYNNQNEQQSKQNQLLINSIQKYTIDKLGQLPLTSKKKSIKHHQVQFSIQSIQAQLFTSNQRNNIQLTQSKPYNQIVQSNKSIAQQKIKQNHKLIRSQLPPINKKYQSKKIIQ